MIRQPIVAVMGHVDHGKTSILDTIRGTATAAREAGGITQAIGASIIPLGTIKQVCGQLLEQLKLKITIPGLLFIDTPGHAAFTSLRKRGGNLADIAILVIDINEGLMPQTKESIEILKQYKTPFIIAANKIDLINGWRQQDKTVLSDINKQRPEVLRVVETKLYELVSQVYELGIQADRFDRVSNYTQQAAIVPVSAKTGEGIPELIMMLTALAQKYLETNLNIAEDGPAKGTILEVKEQKGLGTVIDAIIYDGSLSQGDTIIVGTLDEPVKTKVKALLLPEGASEIREKKTKFKTVKKITAASGVRIVAPGAENAVAGMPILSGEIKEAKSEIANEVGEVLIQNGLDGVIIKADSLGSLEALTLLLKEKQISIRKSSIGPITKKDISDAEAIAQNDPLHGAILGFNIPKPDFTTNAHIIVNDIIYRLIEDYEAWKISKQKQMQAGELDSLVKPCKIEVLRGYVFRQNNPAICGVEVLAGTLNANTPLINNKGKDAGNIKGIQLEQKNVESAEKGKQVAASMPGVTIGRQIMEGDILYSAIPESHFRIYKEHKEHLTDDQKNLLKEIADIMRRDNPMWGL